MSEKQHGRTKHDLDELLPPGREYFREEWAKRTWWGRITLFGEAPMVTVMRTMSKIHRRLPKTYKDGDSDE